MRLILGVSLSRRAIGMAILSYGSLIKWNVQSFNRARGKDKNGAVLHALRQLLTKYPVTAVAVKVPDNVERYKELVKLIGAINVLAEKQGITCRFYLLHEIKRFYSEDIRINKKALMQFVLNRYSVLAATYRKEAHNSKTYYVRIFEAVAAAHVASKDLDDIAKQQV